MFSSKKALLLSVFILMFAFTLSGCGKNEDDANKDTGPNQSQNVNLDQEVDDKDAEDDQEVIEVVDNNEVVEEKTTIVDSVNWRIYTNETLGYTLTYPGICNVSGDLDNAVDFTGPLKSKELWPKITINHNDSEFYNPPLGTDVEEWVNKFPGFKDGTGITIAGLPTVHFVQEKNSQAFAGDYYYFIKDTQLYQITILHTGGKEDWPLYNKFLASFAFTKKEASELSCQTDADCVPMPSCHPTSCINSDFVDQYEQPEICTLQFECQAAYTAEDCLCQQNVCVNKNKDSLCLE